MKHHLYPVIGHWYQNREYDALFKVVALDTGEDESQNVEVQYFSGEIEEIDLDSWYEYDLQDLPPPEDWSAPFQLSSEEVDRSSDEAIRPEDWAGPLNEIEPDDLQ